jgi:hypothetical protein
MNAKEAASIVAVIAAAHPQWPASRETVAIYRQMLSDLPYANTFRAVQEIIALDDRWPSVATVRKRAVAMGGGIAPNASDAWAEVCDAIRSNGRTSIPEWSHPAIQRTVETLGWWELCNGTSPETTRAHFRRLYDENRAVSDELTVLDGLELMDGYGNRPEIDGSTSETRRPALRESR